MIGVEDVTVVPEQELPDGNFPTCPYPNPEIKQAFECAINLSKTKRQTFLLQPIPIATDSALLCLTTANISL